MVKRAEYVSRIAFDNVGSRHSVFQVCHAPRQGFYADGLSAQRNGTVDGGAKAGEGVQDKVTRCSAPFNNVVHDVDEHVYVFIGTRWTLGEECVVPRKQFGVERGGFRCTAA